MKGVVHLVIEWNTQPITVTDVSVVVVVVIVDGCDCGVVCGGHQRRLLYHLEDVGVHSSPDAVVLALIICGDGYAAGDVCHPQLVVTVVIIFVVHVCGGGGIAAEDVVE